MGRQKPEQKLYLVFLEMEKGGVRDVNVRAASTDAAGRRALKRTKGALKVHRVERGI